MCDVILSEKRDRFDLRGRSNHARIVTAVGSAKGYPFVHDGGWNHALHKNGGSKSDS